MGKSLQSNFTTSQDKDFLANAFSEYIKYWKWFAAIISVCLVFAIVYIKVKEPVYSLSASLIVKKEDQKASSMMATAMMKNFGGGIGSMLASESTEDEMQILGSQNIIRKVVSSLNLFTTYDLAKFPVNKSLYKNSPILIEANPSVIDTLSTYFSFKVKVESEGINVYVKAGKADLGSYDIKILPASIKTRLGTFRLVANNAAKMSLPYKLNITVGGLDPVAENLKENLKIATLNKKTDVIGLSIEDEIRQRGKDILNEIIRQYNIDALSDKNKTAFNTTQFLKIRIDSLYSELNGIEANIESYKKANKFVDAGTELSLTLGKISQLQEKNSTSNIQLAIINSIENQIKRKSNGFELLPSSIGLPAGVVSAVDKYNDIVLYRMRILRNSKEENPVIQAIDEQLKLLNKNLLVSLQNAKNDIGVSQADSKEIESEVNSRVGQMPRMEREYVDLKRQQELKSQIYLFLLQKMEETQLTLASTEAKAKVVDQAYALIKPVAPKKIILLLAALVGGFFIAAITVCILIVTNKKVDSSMQLQTFAECEVFDPISLDGDNALALRSLCTNILAKLQTSSDGRVIVVSSIEPAEGKADLVLKLSESFARAGFKTLVVDLDFVSFSLSRRLNLTSAKGISNYILKSATQQDIVRKSEMHPDLDLIPAGNQLEALEMYSSKVLDQIFKQLRKDYELLVVDAVALDQVPDALLLSSISDLNLFTVEIGKASKHSVSQLNTFIREDKIRHVYTIAMELSRNK
ncbi:MAG: tyrosine-protein kinase ptk [Bacteroidetes bacterium]|nr:tyrosine-protein kinase ptk [Bacteroidota bacterium]